LSGYSYKELDFPGSSEVLARSINDSGAVVGLYFGTISYGGFLYGSDGQYSTLPTPFLGESDPQAINNLGNIVGDNFWIDNGTYEGLFAPGAISGETSAVSLNNSNEIIGFYFDSSGRNGFSYIGGNYTNINVPNATGYTSPTAINDSGEIVGYYTETGVSGSFGFIYNDGTYVTIPTPENAYSLVPEAVNASGEITGFYENDDTSTNAFVYADGKLTTLGSVRK
jgi:probable HAF family extracellular repeat protein